ncbi:RMD1 family protein [Candidatus Protochlamydia phocaeensis]|uniref:RMD1 family protein n=1 Tax=Candidatus Protochlamydia phocaeensis TaxID=1414722 RepID=UPI000838D70C|nr:RMD1 family protein [Candidatus Protochlamydia phocaeensis]
MDCRAYCTASSYQIKSLYESLKSQGASLYRDVIHFPVPGESIGDVFYFSYGATVCWGLTPEKCRFYLNLIKNFEEQPLAIEDVEMDEFTFTFGDVPKIVGDEIILPNRDVLNRLAISHGLAQSVKLGTFENAIRRTFNHTKHIPEDLAKHGRIPLSRQEIRKKMGDLFIERNSINLHLDVLDTPEFFWEYSELEPLYAMTDNYLDIDARVEVLNQRLDVVHELFEMLGNELNHQHSSRLEWTIIWLIIIEVLLSLLRDVFRVI